MNRLSRYSHFTKKEIQEDNDCSYKETEKYYKTGNEAWNEISSC